MRRSFFRMVPGSKRYFTQWMHDVYRNKVLFSAVVFGFVTVFPLNYIPGLNRLKKSYQPLLLSVEGGKLVIKNKYDFVGVQHLSATYKVEELGESTSHIAAGSLEIPAIAAGETVSVELPASLSNIKSTEDVFLTVSFRLKESTNWAEPSHEIAWIQHQLSSAEAPASAAALNTLTSKLTVEKTRARATISGLDFSFVFDTARGLLVSWTAGDKTLLEKDPATGAALIPNFWRPPTDNDVPVACVYWKRFGVHELTSQLRSIDIVESADKVEISTKTFLSPPVLAWGFETTSKYTISATGKLTVDVDLTPTGRMPTTIPRAGFNLHLPKALSQVKYLGLGPDESYPDKQTSQRVGVYSATVPELQTHYEVPQENGNRMAT
ncbi:hypothetical protein BN1723_017900, partial [Verticillium longisporum]